MEKGKIIGLSIALIFIAVILPIGLNLFYANRLCKYVRVTPGASDILVFKNGTEACDESGFEYSSTGTFNETLRIIASIAGSLETDIVRPLYFRILVDNVTRITDFENSTIQSSEFVAEDITMVINTMASRNLNNETQTVVILIDIATTALVNLEIELFFMEEMCDEDNNGGNPLANIWGLVPLLIVIAIAVGIMYKRQEN